MTGLIIDIEELRKKLRQIKHQRVLPEIDFPIELLSSNPKPAAVLIPLFLKSDQWHMLFTRRNEKLSEHGGQVAFPGGMTSEGDPNPETTALREAQEEIGLHPRDVQILGRMHDFLTITNYRVTPVIGVIPWPYQFHLAENEVSAIFSIPISWLNDPDNYEVRIRNLPHPHPPIKVIYFCPYQGHTLWGASAKFTLALLEILNHTTG